MKRTGKLTVGIVTLALMVLVTAHANNIRVENMATRFQNVTAADTVYVDFDLKRIRDRQNIRLTLPC